MVKLNLEVLNTTELRNLAEQENVDDYEVLDRDDLINALLDLFEDLDASYLKEGQPFGVKYFSTFSDYKEHSENIYVVPGTESLPDSYDETSIHIMYKNSDWVFAFWSISSSDEKKKRESNGTFSLLVSLKYYNGLNEKYDILISDDDKEWNIGISSEIESVRISLVLDYSDGKRETMTDSPLLSLSTPYFIAHKDETRNSDNLLSLALSLVVDRYGEYFHTSSITDLIKAYYEGDKDEQS